ncbi:MAG: ABC transporter ATP-binding protein [Deltaproteobacteria bacterium]|nr:ABC transporter ATP-binding protein [Deltaproteobacteria bacterium]
MNAIEVEHLWKKFRLSRTHPRGGSLWDIIPQTIGRLFGRNGGSDDTFWALKDVSFSVARGDALGIIGPNGAGKSTILKLLSGILRPDRGTIRVNGRVAALIELGAGFHPDLTGRENVYLNGAILGLKKQEIASKFDEIVEFAGIEEFIDTPIKHYSSGMAVRLGFAVAAHMDPDLFLIDEVLAVGDMAFQRKCLQKVTALRQVGKTILFVSHNLEAVSFLCPESLLLRASFVSYLGPTREAISAYLRPDDRVLPSLSENSLHRAQPRGPVRITGVRLCNASDRETAVVISGEEARIIVLLEVTEDIKDPVVGYILRNSAGVEVYNTNSFWQRKSCGTLKANQQVVVEFRQRFSLVSGTYFLSTGIATEDLTAFYDWREHVLSLRVEASDGDRGIANLRSTILINGFCL